MDVFVWMAEHVAIRGLDDKRSPPDQHYISTLPASVGHEPYSAYHEAEKAAARRAHSHVRRIECLAAAHHEMRLRAERQLQELRSRPSTSEDDLAQAQIRLDRLGEYPCIMTANSDTEWHNMRECDAPHDQRFQFGMSVYSLRE
jgi:hypothetical protein